MSTALGLSIQQMIWMEVERNHQLMDVDSHGSPIDLMWSNEIWNMSMSVKFQDCPWIFRPWYIERSIEILHYIYISYNLYVALLEYRHLFSICLVENFFQFQHVQPARSLVAVPVRRAVFWPSSLIAVTPYAARHNEGSLRHRRWSNRHPPWWCCRHRWNWGRQLGLEGFGV